MIYTHSAGPNAGSPSDSASTARRYGGIWRLASQNGPKRPPARTRYRDDDRLPSERKLPRGYRTRIDPFAEVWDDVQKLLEAQPRLQAKTLFDDLQRKFPGQFPSSTRRTFERRVTNWRSLHGPNKTVFFPQDHHPGRLAASDFAVCNELGVRIAGAQFIRALGSKAKFMVIVDGAYAARCFVKPLVDDGVTVISRLRSDAKIFNIPGKRTGWRGRPCKYGKNQIVLPIEPHGDGAGLRFGTSVEVSW